MFQKDREGNISLGGDANKAIGFLPQSSAACFMMDNLLLLWGALVEVGGEDWLPANCVVHDSYLLAVPPERVEWAMATLARILTRPIAEMGGLRVGCEMSTGANWGDMQTAQIVGVS